MSDLDDAMALAGIVVVLGVLGPLLWMANNMGTAEPKTFMLVGVSVIWEVAVPAFGLIVFFFVILKLASIARGA